MREGKEASLVNNAHNEMVGKGLKGYVAGAALIHPEACPLGSCFGFSSGGRICGQKGTAASS